MPTLENDDQRRNGQHVGGRDIDVSARGSDMVETLDDRPVVLPDDRPVVVRDDLPVVVPDPRRPRLRRPVLVIGAAAILVAATAAGVAAFLGGQDTVVAEATDQGPPAAVVPAALAVTVDAPAQVVAGEQARFVVHYTDGEGIFSGRTEDWGDAGVGSGSVQACGAAAPAAGLLDDTYVVRHGWEKAGTYPVRFEVTTYTCTAGQPVMETRSTKLQVSVTTAP
ncbi:MAG: hypothetical protein QOE19_4044 [Actinomycetota bacterium]|nr:hypothetical protein [Actinomycetota bacterium]